MGRYYRGDIEGKFWFGIQNSDDAKYFGGNMTEPSTAEFDFSDSDLHDISSGIVTCKGEVGKYEGILDDYFSTHDSYSDKELSSDLLITTGRLDELLLWYARLKLGEKILKCVQDKGSCTFEADLA